METITKSVVVNAPRSTDYKQTTQFEDFPHFMEGVKSIRQTDDTQLHRNAEIGGKDVQWMAEIT
ncbi:MAG: SRPBCC family protein [Betaproteobacteria bacterium]